MEPHPNLSDGMYPRPATREDARSVFDLVAAHETATQGEAEIAFEDLLSDWQRPSFDLAKDAVVVFDGDRLVAEAEIFKGRRAEVTVHPDALDRGIGTWLLAWAERRARSAGGTLVGQTVPDSSAGAVDILRRNDYEPLWASWVLQIDLDAPPAPPVLPPGFVLRASVPGEDDRAIYEVIERAFSEWPDRDGTRFEDWYASTIGRERFDPTLLLVIEQMSEAVGVAFCIDADDEGWVQTLAVAREHRGRGLGRALLQQAFVEFQRRGRSRVQLSTDSRTGSLGLYEHVGMRVMRSYTHYAKQI